MTDQLYDPYSDDARRDPYLMGAIQVNQGSVAWRPSSRIAERPIYLSYDNLLVVGLQMSFIGIAALGTTAQRGRYQKYLAMRERRRASPS